MRQTIYPAVRYADADAALDFLKEAFGASERAVFRDDAGVIRHGELELAGSLVMIGAYGAASWLGGEPPRPLSSTVSLYVVLPERGDVDAHHARAVAAGGIVVRELADQPYGSREYSVRDPEGNLWSFGTYDPSA
jgi:uncharacterized glyoxalase superfamily protein PhnB